MFSSEAQTFVIFAKFRILFTFKVYFALWKISKHRTIFTQWSQNFVSWYYDNIKQPTFGH